jgi:hypothetical protein
LRDTGGVFQVQRQDKGAGKLAVSCYFALLVLSSPDTWPGGGVKAVAKSVQESDVTDRPPIPPILVPSMTVLSISSGV